MVQAAPICKLLLHHASATTRIVVARRSGCQGSHARTVCKFHSASSTYTACLLQTSGSYRGSCDGAHPCLRLLCHVGRRQLGAAELAHDLAWVGCIRGQLVL
jgi:hypothetical protein